MRQRAHGWAVGFSLAALGGSASAESLPVSSVVIPITPLSGLAPAGGSGEGSVQAAAALPLVTLPRPSGNLAGFGEAVAAFTTAQFDYVVVGAPGAGRAWVFKKALTSSSFAAPTELIPISAPLGGFGRSVAMRDGTIAVGANGAVYTFSQPRTSSGIYNETQQFIADSNRPQQFTSALGFGRMVSFDGNYESLLIACSDGDCETFYPVRPFASSPPSWTLWGAIRLGDAGVISTFPSALATQGHIQRGSGAQGSNLQLRGK